MTSKSINITFPLNLFFIYFLGQIISFVGISSKQFSHRRAKNKVGPEARQDILGYAEIINNPMISVAYNSKGSFYPRQKFPLWFGA